jgi:hypothetical protein
MLLRALIALFFLVTTAIASAQDLKWMRFEWTGDSISGKYFDKSSIIIPVKVNDIPANFTMQFDLGAVKTVIYGKSIKPYLAAYPALKSRIDTSKKFLIQGENNPVFTNMELRTDGINFKGIEIGYFENFGSQIDPDSINSGAEKHIGTIGPDLFKNSILIIDYPGKKIGVCQELPEQLKKASFQPFLSDDGRIKIPLTIDDSVEYLLFDTGSSLFTLTASKENALKTADHTIEDSLTVMSWGKQLTFYGVRTKKAVKFGNKVLSGSLIYYDEQRTFEDFYRFAKIWGLTGNAFFLKNTVIIDYKHKLFGVL